ncbi:MAG: Crp/Fnr family transcriptional regulator [Magnetococcales bacterium]|nr:Crp/Fnr family transcriptional regulator [Magnetococcales bacterium]
MDAMSKEQKESVDLSGLQQGSQSSILGNLTDLQWQQLRPGLRWLKLPAKSFIFNQEQPFTSFYFLKRGLVKLARTSAEGEEKVLRFIHPGETFATPLLFLDKHQYLVDAATIRPSEILEINAERFKAILRESPETCFQIMGHLSLQINCHLTIIDGLCLRNARGRLIGYLLENLIVNGQGGALNLDVPKHLLASYLSIKPATLSRLLREMDEAGVIVMDARRITVPDLDALMSWRESRGRCGDRTQAETDASGGDEAEPCWKLPMAEDDPAGRGEAV